MDTDSQKPADLPQPSTEIKPDSTAAPEESAATETTSPSDTTVTVTSPTDTEKEPESPEAEDTETESESPVAPPETLASEEVTPPPAESGEAAANTPVTPGPAVSGSHKSKSWLLIVVLILVIVAVGGAALYKHHSTKKQAAVSTKKDIPLITYGLSGTDLSTLYPSGVNTEGATLADAQLFEGLVRYSGQTKIVPLLATGWTNPDNTDWLFTLRSGVKFHDGDTLTASDVKYSLDYAVAHQNDNDGATLMSLANTIKTVTVVDTTHVKITTDGPDPTLLNRLASLYIIDSKATVGDPDAGTGPYVVKTGTTPTKTDLYLTAANDYWGGHVYTKALHLASVASSDNLASGAQAGTYDIAGPVTTAQIATLHPKQDLAVQELAVTFLGLNTLKTGSPLSSLPVRQAMGYALNVPAILKAANADGKQVNQLIPSTFPGYDSSLPTNTYDPTKAKTLLTGVTNLSTPLTLVYTSSHQSEITEIAKELTAVGFNIKLQSEPDLGTVVKLGLGGKVDMFYVGYGSDILDGLDVIQSVVIGNADYSSPAVEALATKASSTIDPTTRISLLQQIEQQIAKDVPDVPLYTLTSHYAVLQPYQGLTVDIPSSSIGAYFWTVHQ